MLRNRSANLLLFSLLLLVHTVGAEEPRQLVLFGGYSHLSLTDQPRVLLKSANLNGWNVSLKLNVAPRVGVLADFSGHYGQRGLTLFNQDPVTVPVHRHTYLFGPEVRVLESGRLTAHLRALVGVAHTNSLDPQFARFRFPVDSNAFAASFGGSLDYRINDRFAYRILQPELLLTRSGSSATENWQEYSFRLSTGLVFASGKSAGSGGRAFSFGFIGGAALTDAFAHESTGFVSGPNGAETIRSRAYSSLKDYVIGPMLEVPLPWAHLSVEFDALYRPMNLTLAGVTADGSLHSISPATVVTWQFPVLAKYRFGSRVAKPFLEAGPSFRVAGNKNGSSPSAYGVSGGVGVEGRLRRLAIGPVARYTHWARDPLFTNVPSRPNQLELLIALSF